MAGATPAVRCAVRGVVAGKNRASMISSASRWLAETRMNEMPWWGILLIVVAIFIVLFVWLMLGMGVGEATANIFLISVLAFAALLYGAWRWSMPRPKDDA